MSYQSHLITEGIKPLLIINLIFSQVDITHWKVESYEHKENKHKTQTYYNKKSLSLEDMMAYHGAGLQIDRQGEAQWPNAR